MTFARLEENTDTLLDAQTHYQEIETASKTNIFNYLSTIGRVSSLRDATVTSGSGAVTNDGVEYNVSTTANGADDALLRTKERGRYAPGVTAEVGLGIRTTERPTGNQLWRAGIFNGSDGLYFGEDSTGVFVARERDGNVKDKTYQENWNLDVLDGSAEDDNPSNYTLDLDEGVILRIVYAWYGHGQIQFQVVMRDPLDESQIVIPVHNVYPVGETSTRQANLPVEAMVENDGTADSYTLFVAGRQFSIIGDEKPDFRVNGENRLGQSVDGTWTPLIGFEKDSGQDNIDVKPDSFTVSTDTTVEVAVLTESELSDGTYELPGQTSSSETVVSVNDDSTGFTTEGERRFTDVVTATQGSATEVVKNELDFNVPAEEEVVLAARSSSGTATVDSSFRWEEFF